MTMPAAAPLSEIVSKILRGSCRRASTISSAGTTYSVARSTSVRPTPGPFSRLPDDEGELDLDPRPAVVGVLDLGAVGDHHVVEQVARSPARRSARSAASPSRSGRPCGRSALRRPPSCGWRPRWRSHRRPRSVMSGQGLGELDRLLCGSSRRSIRISAAFLRSASDSDDGLYPRFLSSSASGGELKWGTHR